ncbi:MAG: J domain-containing protein [Gemmatimonadaceae bacterium]|nr:J domain-containing protein [Gemmatimonadaceae bacterium]
MPANRRNYYRLLHVQADAPAEVIKAAYRALIALHHPDKGGTHETAAMLNEAYAVLSDEARRTAYDAKRATKLHRPATDAARPSAPPKDGADVVRRGCPMCRSPLPAVIHAATRCARCQSPLAPIQRTNSSAGGSERRALRRISKSDWGLLHLEWPSEAIDVRMRDMSLDGISLYCGAAVTIGRTVRIVGENFDVVADVVSCRRVSNVFTVHARLVTAAFKSGGFVSAHA